MSWVPLNQSQMQALDNRLSQQRDRAHGVWGPPGTGKTVVLAYEACRAAVELDERVFVGAFQNSTVDQTLRYIITLLNRHYGWNMDVIRGAVKRTGHIAKVDEDIRQFYTRSYTDASAARIVGCTLYSSFVPTGQRVLDPDSFNRIILDETGQASPEQAFIPFRLLRDSPNSVLTAYGDDVQLSPISPDFIQEMGVLRYLRSANQGAVDMLDTSYRLNWPGVRMTSDVFYSGRLNAPEDVRNRRLRLNSQPSGPLREALREENTLVYVGVRGNEIEDGLSCDNYAQAQVITDLCSDLIRLGVSPQHISVIAAYRPHVRTINALLDSINEIGRCTTVHRILGGENDVIIFATTRSNSSRDLGFLRQPELLNVATSRQLRKLIIVGDAGETFSEGSRTSRRIHDFISQHGVVLTVNSVT